MSRIAQGLSAGAVGSAAKSLPRTSNVVSKSKLPFPVKPSKPHTPTPRPFEFSRLSSSSSISPLLAHGSTAFPPSQLALLSPEARHEHELITSTLKKALFMDPVARKKLFVEQDRRNKILFDFQPNGQPVVPAFLLTVINQLVPPTSTLTPSESLQVVRPLLARVTTMVGKPDYQADIDALTDRLFSFAPTLEASLEMATFFFNATAPKLQFAARTLCYPAQNSLLFTVSKIDPPPPPTALIDFMNTQRAKMRLVSFTHHPLGKLLEIYNRYFAGEYRRLRWKSEEESEELQANQAKHLLVIREIHQALKELKPLKFTVRNCSTLVDAYARAKGYDEALEVWGEMRKEGGVGIDDRCISIFFDFCGFSGRPSLAISTRQTFDTENILLNANNWAAYHECLVRSGSWVDLLTSFADQVSRHKLDPKKTPPLIPEAVSPALILASNMLYWKKKSTAGGILGAEDWEALREGTKELLSEEDWAKVEKDIQARKWVKTTVDKTGKGRRA